MFRRLLARVAPAQPDTAPWWRDANAMTAAPTRDGVAALRGRMVNAELAPDAAELQEEMLDGLERLAHMATATGLPVVATQHRVIGDAVCHFIAPMSLIDEVDVPGKVFATSDRLVFAAGAVKQWPWHLIAAISRHERDVIVDLRSRPVAARLRANTFADALELQALAHRLRVHRS